jgi:magnesium chelatase family protein
MLALRLNNLLPAPGEEELAAIIKIHSAAGFSDLSNLFAKRPFRSPHHSASSASITGGGRPVMPGETSLAHRGILFLDELPEFNRQVLESLREPMESKEVMITRANSRVRYPAAFQLVAAMNPCPVGRTCNENTCLCSTEQKRRYRTKISAPILDRIDIHVQVEPVSEKELFANNPVTRESEIRADIFHAHSIQRKRNANRLNSELSSTQLNEHCQLDEITRKLLKQAISRFELSARACHRLLKVSRTIADLEQARQIEERHMSEALSYRQAAVQ